MTSAQVPALEQVQSRRSRDRISGTRVGSRSGGRWAIREALEFGQGIAVVISFA